VLSGGSGRGVSNNAQVTVLVLTTLALDGASKEAKL
jgi:hypothetical protein